MSYYGRLNTAAVTETGTWVKVYQSPVVTDGSEIRISILNMTAAEVTIQVALTMTDGVVQDADFIENGAIIPENGGVLERDGLKISRGEFVYVKSTGAVTVRVSGQEVVLS